MCCIAGALMITTSVLAAVPTVDLFHQLDPRLPHGDYRIPSLVTTRNGTLLAFAAGRMHRTDITPNIIYMRRSTDDGKSWEQATPLLSDATNHTEFGGAPIVDPASGAILYVFNANIFGSHEPCVGCQLWIIRSTDDGITWTDPEMIQTGGGQPANATYGTPLASGVVLTQGQHAGRLLVALRHDCGCHDLRASFAIYSDDHGVTWRGGAEMVLLPQFGGGWTECQVAELRNGSVLMTSRNFYGRSSGQGPRLFARSDDGGATWAANWSAGSDLPDPYCEASLLSAPASNELLLFGNPSSARHRANFSVHASRDGGLSWPESVVVYPGGATYSDMSFTSSGDLVVLFEKDEYNTIAFGTLRVPW